MVTDYKTTYSKVDKLIFLRKILMKARIWPLFYILFNNQEINKGITFLYFIAKVIRGSIRDSLLMNCGSDRIATHQTIYSPNNINV